jgi:hypothetical protein
LGVGLAYCFLPSLHIEALFGKLGRQDRSPGELPSGKSLNRRLRLFGVFVLDVDFPDACA